MTTPPISQLQWLASTVYMEAEGEPFHGKLAVAFAIANRARRGKRSISDVVLQAWQFSAWNTDSVTRMKLDSIKDDDPVWLDCARAAVEAYFQTAEDPIDGRTLYINEAVVMAISGSLPGWWKQAGERDAGVVIGGHTFRRDI